MAKKKLTKSVPTPDQYLSFISAMALQGVGLDDAKVNINRVALTQATSSDDVAQLALEANFGVLQHSDKELVVGAKLNVYQTQKSNSLNKLLSIECSFSALFHLGLPASQESATRFANTEAKLVFWPYFRHFISDTSYRMAITPILVPLITMSDQQKKLRVRSSGDKKS